MERNSSPSAIAAGLPDGKVYATVEQVAAHFGVAKSSVWNWVAKGYHGFPEPVRLTPGCTRWRMSDILEWEAKRVAVSKS